MGIVLLAILLVILIPFAEGWLLALTLRAIHLSHPLPLGDPVLEIPVTESTQEQEYEPLIPPEETTDTDGKKGWVEGDSGSEWGKQLDLGSGNIQKPRSEPAAPEPDPPPASQPANQPESQPVSVFDGNGPAPSNILVNSILDSMFDENKTEVPQDLESRIAESDSGSETFQQLEQADEQLSEDEDKELANILAAVLPETPIEFNVGESPDFSPMAKELLGADFNFNSLEPQPATQDLPTTSPAEPPIETQEMEPSVEPDIRPSVEPNFEPGFEPGFFQASAGQFLADDLPELSALSAEVAIPTFPDAWVQETDIEPAYDDAAKQYSFIEESQPMFVRKKRKREIDKTEHE